MKLKVVTEFRVLMICCLSSLPRKCMAIYESYRHIILVNALVKMGTYNSGTYLNSYPTKKEGSFLCSLCTSHYVLCAMKENN